MRKWRGESEPTFGAGFPRFLSSWLGRPLSFFLSGPEETEEAEEAVETVKSRISRGEAQQAEQAQQAQISEISFSRPLASFPAKTLFIPHLFLYLSSHFAL